jgi:hypothetical protein
MTAAMVGHPEVLGRIMGRKAAETVKSGQIWEKTEENRIKPTE